MPKVRSVENKQNDGKKYWMIFCPACECGHKFVVPLWSFNGDMDKPTFSPSMLVKSWDGYFKIPKEKKIIYRREESGCTYDVPMYWVGDDCPPTLEAVAKRLGVKADPQVVQDEVTRRICLIPVTTCHSFVTDGKIQFLSDCTHKMAGQTVDLPETDKW